MPEYEKRKGVELFLIDGKQYKDFRIVSTKINMLVNCQLLKGAAASN